MARCGDCRLWAPNFYADLRASCRGTTCCADVVMDLPASFIPNRQTMRADEGEDCICFEHVTAAHFTEPDDLGDSDDRDFEAFLGDRP